MYALLFAWAAEAAPEDITLKGMTDFQGQHVTGDLSGDYLQLVAELGTMIANRPLYPAKTLGASGFDVSFTNTFAFVTAQNPDGSPGPWMRANIDDDVGSYYFIPQVSVRKGLPLSTEVGMSAAWLGLTHSGTFGGWARVGLVEGYKPIPDVSLHFGYAGFVGNDELEVGSMDMGVSLGSSYAFGSFPGINNAVWQPIADATIVVVHARPTIPAATAAEIGAIAVGTQDQQSVAALFEPQFTGGFQLVNGTVLFRLMGTFAPKTIPMATIGMGFTY